MLLKDSWLIWLFSDRQSISFTLVLAGVKSPYRNREISLGKRSLDMLRCLPLAAIK